MQLQQDDKKVTVLTTICPKFQAEPEAQAGLNVPVERLPAEILRGALTEIIFQVSQPSTALQCS